MADPLEDCSEYEKMADAEMAQMTPSRKLRDGVLYYTEATLKRIGAIALAVGPGYVVVLGFEKSYEILSRPFAQMSPIDLIIGLGIGAACLWGVALTLGLAFSGHETRDEWYKQRKEARRNEIIGRLMQEDKAKARRSQATRSS